MKVTRSLCPDPYLTSAVKTPLPKTFSSTTNVAYPSSSNSTESLIFSFVKESKIIIVTAVRGSPCIEKSMDVPVI